MQLSKTQAKNIRKLHLKKYRADTLMSFGEGFRLIKSAFTFIPDQIAEIVLSESINDIEKTEIINQATENKIPVYFTNQKTMNSISTETTPPGIFFTFYNNYLVKDDLEKLRSNNILYLENISDPGNLGTIIRTAVWFGINSIILSPGSVEPLNPKVIRASAGALFICTIYNQVELSRIKKFANDNEYPIISTVIDGGINLNLWQKCVKNLIFLGSEANGLSKDALSISDELITIPGTDQIDSLNVSVSAALVLNHLYNKE